MSGGPSASHDRTVRATHLNCLTVFSGPTDTLSQPIRAVPINLTIQTSPTKVHKTLTHPPINFYGKISKSLYNEMHARPTFFLIKIFTLLKNFETSHARTTLGAFRL